MIKSISANIAKQLNIKDNELQRKSLKIFLERELLVLKTEFLSLAIKYNLNSIKEFERAIEKGEIHETQDTRGDFFRLDYLEKRIKLIEDFLRNV